MTITWRNVEGPSFKEAILAGTAAQQQMSSGFDSFNKVLEQETKTNLANWDNTKQNNTQAFLDQVAQYRTPEEFQAAQASGALNALRQRYGAQIDQAAIRGAEDKRVGELTDRVLKANAYADDTELRTQRPIEQSYYQKLYSGDTAGAASVLKDNPNLRNMPAMAKLFDDYSAAKTTREREGVLFEHQKNLMPLEIADKRAGINLKNAQAAASREGSGSSGSRAARIAALLKDNPYAQSGTYSSNHTPDLMKLMSDNNIGDDQGERVVIIDRLNKLGEVPITVTDKDGVKQVVKVPPSLADVKAALLSSEDQFFNGWNQGWANSFETNLRNRMQATSTRKVGDKEVPYNRTVDEYHTYLNATKEGAFDKKTK